MIGIDTTFFTALRDRLLSEKKFVITTHRTPDPDGIGAMLALDYYLRQQGKTTDIITGEPSPAKFHFLDPERRLLDSSALAQNPGKYNDCVLVMIDNSDVDRMGNVRPILLPDQSNLIIIDHHDGARPDLRQYFQLPSYGSSSEILYELLKFVGADYPVHIATGLFAGIVADTGSFRYSKTRPRTLVIGAELMERGVDPASISESLFMSGPLARLYLKRDLYQSLQIYDGHLAYFQIRKSDVERMSLTVDDLDGIVNELLEPDAIKAAVLFTERERGITRVSIRSRQAVDMIPAVQRYGGGGHKNACGATIPLDLEKAVREFIPIASACIR